MGLIGNKKHSTYILNNFERFVCHRFLKNRNSNLKNSFERFVLNVSKIYIPFDLKKFQSYKYEEGTGLQSH